MVDAIDMVRFLSGDIPIPRREVSRLSAESEYVLAYNPAINLTITPLSPANLTGTVAVEHLSPDVVGTDTLFTTQLYVGDTIIIGTEVFVVYSIKDNTHLTLDSPYQGTDASEIVAKFNSNFTYDHSTGVVTFTHPVTDTLIFAYDSVWFEDEQIENMLVYKTIDKELTLIENNKFKFDIPYYPVRYSTNPSSATFDADTLTFTAGGDSLRFTGTVVDVYSTAATLLLIMPSYPMKIRKEFMGFNDWGDFPTISRGLQAQSDRLFKLSGV